MKYKTKITLSSILATAAIRKYLPNTFLNIRLSPVEIARSGPDEVRETVIRLVRQSGGSAGYRLTGICCINMDDTVKDKNVGAIFEARNELLEEAGAMQLPLKAPLYARKLLVCGTFPDRTRRSQKKAPR